MTKKIIVSGNPNYGLALALHRQFPKAKFASRSSSQTDLTDPTQSRGFAEETLNYDVYISCSCLHRFQQVLLVEEVHNLWTHKKHKGHIIMLGSTADTPVKGTPWLYPIEKKALKAYSRNLSLWSLGGHGHAPSGVRVTYLSIGYMATPSMEKKHPDVYKLNCDYVAQVIEWILNQPETVNINELSIDPIQT